MNASELIGAVTLAISLEQPAPWSAQSDTACMARNIWFEARGSSFTDKLAVGHVVLNRTTNPRFPVHICDVIYQPSQFSWTQDGWSDDILIKNPIDELAWQESLLATAMVLAGELPDITHGATHYHADYVSPDWADASAVSARIGAHVYYDDIAPAAGNRR